VAIFPNPAANNRYGGTDTCSSVALHPCTWVNVGAGNNWNRICREHFRASRSGVYHSSSLFIAVDCWEGSRDEFIYKLRRAVGLSDPSADEPVEHAFRQFAARNLYLQGDLTAADTYARLKAILDRRSAIRVFYLGLPGFLTAAAIDYLQESCCRTGDYIVSDKPWWHLRGDDAAQRQNRVA
jgi:glucose-6-phosphate 1-dehydrogenase